MARHEFGIMDENPVAGERYDMYEPERFGMISVDDDFIEPLLPALDEIDYFWHTLDIPGKGLAYTGITLIPPTSVDAIVGVIENVPELFELKEVLLEAKSKNRFVIHYGL